MKYIDTDACHMSFCQDTKLSFWEFKNCVVRSNEHRKNDTLFHDQNVSSLDNCIKDKIRFFIRTITGIETLSTPQVHLII